jgi:hypothetical protein
LGYGVQIVEKKEIQVAFRAALHAAISNSTKHLLVTDPYIFNCHDKQLSWYPRFLKSVFEPIYPIVPKITFVTSQQYDRRLLTDLQYNAKKGGCHIKHFTNNLFHDRFWVSAGTQTGIFVGNSLTSIGSQYCYLGILPSTDVQVALKALRTYL